MHLRTTILPMVRNIRHSLSSQWTHSRQTLHCQQSRAALLPGPWACLLPHSLMCDGCTPSQRMRLSNSKVISTMVTRVMQCAGGPDQGGGEQVPVLPQEVHGPVPLDCSAAQQVCQPV